MSNRHKQQPLHWRPYHEEMEQKQRYGDALSMVYNNKLRIDRFNAFPRYDWSSPVTPLVGQREFLSRTLPAAPQGQLIAA